MKPSNVYGIVRSDEAARAAVDALRAAGIDKECISLLARADDPRPELRPGAAGGNHLRAPQGVGVGAAVGGTIGWLATVGALTLSGAGPVIAAGPLLTALGGAAVGAASGMVAGSFLGLGMSEIEARELQEAAVRGDVVLAVRVASLDEQARATRALAASGADRITTTKGAATDAA